MKGRPPRFCAACGAGLHAWNDHGHARRRCARCGWIWYDNPVPAAVALITRGSRVLLARRAHAPYRGTWDLPGGFLEAGEDAEAGMRRELLEELGVRTRTARLIDVVIERYGTGGFPVLALVYRVVPEPGAMTPADDVSEARWFPVDRVPYREIGFPAMRRVLREWARLTSRRRRSGRARTP